MMSLIEFIAFPIFVIAGAAVGMRIGLGHGVFWAIIGGVAGAFGGYVVFVAVEMMLARIPMPDRKGQREGKNKNDGSSV
ncbi:hypothetical protein CCAX7_56210 [Capsulimonas corticalis]|uniref:Uncharacterized protein n=1 Tax=Capsulimonas corticalis TaxID=2219043 RepID=A0A9N7LCV3_9BACT|nr:hypothetical protein [Capsulimonas corticalis]BDI33570.1 hypothetical protein CCAX7_56210 [Capsulimonas corticalis]